MYDLTRTDEIWVGEIASTEELVTHDDGATVLRGDEDLAGDTGVVEWKGGSKN